MKTVVRPDEEGSPERTKEYQFNPAKLGEAHASCLGKFIGVITDKHPVVIVDNTNIKHWEWRNYAMIARAAGYEVQIQEFRVNTIAAMKTVARRNVHRVPADIVYRMCAEFEPCENVVVHEVFPEKKFGKKLTGLISGWLVDVGARGPARATRKVNTKETTK